MDNSKTNYVDWSPERLVNRVIDLERQLKELNEKYHRPLFPSPRTTLIYFRYLVLSTPTPSKPHPHRLRNPRVEREFDPSKYSTRFIALKFAYLGQRYNGFEHHANNKTPLPTVEEVLWKALNKARLIFPGEPLSVGGDHVNWEGCEYSKCGRTDRGVSAFGQVVGIRVRSNRPLPKKTSNSANHEYEGLSISDIELATLPLHDFGGMEDSSPHLRLEDPDFQESLSFDPIKDEIPYIQVLNRLLPPDIRILAWCPAPPLDFSARFSCRERRYRYFFTQPAFVPLYEAKSNPKDTTHGQSSALQRKEGWLDINAMKDGAKRFEGLHDFRNFCKVDASKQIENFERRIFHADIVEVTQEFEPAAFVRTPPFSEFVGTSHTNGTSEDSTTSIKSGTPKVYTFVLHGSAFLWHQVRHMVAILFLIGQGLESPDLITKLLDIKSNPTKPMYEMAEDAPLVLWDCIFPSERGNPHEDALNWIYVGDGSGEVDKLVPAASQKGAKFGPRGIVGGLWGVWRQKKMDEVLAGMLLNVVVGQGDTASDRDGYQEEEGNAQMPIPTSQRVFGGGDEPRLGGKYVPILDRPRMQSIDVINAKYAARKGFEHDEKIRDTGFRSVVIQPK